MTTSCHKFFGCTKDDCVVLKEGSALDCWEIDPALTPCIDKFVGSMELEDKIHFCRNCLYYQHRNKNEG